MTSGPITIYARDLPILGEGENAKCAVDEEKLMTIFGQYANIDPISVDIQIGNNINGVLCAYAIIKLSNQKDANRLISKVNYKTIKKIPIHLVFFDEEAQKVLKNDEGRALIIHDLNASVQPQDLHDMFGRFGDVIDCEIPLGSDNIAYVLFRRLDDAKCAMKNMNGSAPTGAVPIQVDVDHTNFFTKMFVLPDNINDQNTSTIPENKSPVFEENSTKAVDLAKENERLRKENAELKEKLEVYEKKGAN